MKTAYDVLGITFGASDDDVKSAYRRKAKEYHPDVSRLSNAKSLFEEANEAYQVLIDPVRRMKLDMAIARQMRHDSGLDAFGSSLNTSLDKPRKQRKKKKQKEPKFPTASPAEYEPIPDGFQEKERLGGLL
jgi:curved DNA-binding protein CbpA